MIVRSASTSARPTPRVAYVEHRPGGDPLAPAVRVFEVPQLVAPGEVQPRPVLPSFLYLADEHERASGALAPPWDARARIRSASSRAIRARWCRRGKSRPRSPGWRTAASTARRRSCRSGTSPGCAGRLAGRGLGALPRAHPRRVERRRGRAATRRCGSRRQQIVLTVPASFDEEARELTIAAARAGGTRRSSR